MTHVETRSRRLALAVLCTGMLMIILDGTIVSVALPAVQSDLGFTPEGLAWTVNAYLVPLGGLLLLAGRLGDLYGRRRMLVTGLLIRPSSGRPTSSSFPEVGVGLGWPRPTCCWRSKSSRPGRGTWIRT